MAMPEPQPERLPGQDAPMPHVPERKRMWLSPLNQRRWRNFKKNRRAYWSLIIFSVLFITSLFAEFLANDKPILVQYRGEYVALNLVRDITQRKQLIEDLDALRILLFEEMVESGKVTRFQSTIVSADGNTEDAGVVRIGVYNLITGDRFLKYNTEDPNQAFIEELARQPQDRFRNMSQALFEASPGEVVGTAVDPSRGSLLGLLIQAPSLRERIDQGGVVGYVIIVLGVIGLLIAVWRLLYLSGVGAGIRKQLKSETPNEKNPLGRILKVYDDNVDTDTETLELKLDEAILREAPNLEKWQGGIKVLAAVAPLLGLLGTVTGMIATFQAITLFGTGDPKLMAGGISEALVTTWLGLIVAIPLVLLHSVVAGRSRGLIEILEEQTAGIIAKQSEGGA